jgi:undecaprenyl-diphosphatase
LLAQLRLAAAGARILGVAGGDGTVRAASAIALETGLPLLVVPAGTFNHSPPTWGSGPPATPWSRCGSARRC